MTGILRFNTPHGVVAVEVADDVALAAGGNVEETGPVAKGLGARGREIVADAPTSLQEAMSTLRAYAASIEDMILQLDLTPREVGVEVGLKVTGSAGFIIAKAGAESEMKVSLKWQPRAD